MHVLFPQHFKDHALMVTGPDLVEELVFDGSGAQYHADAVRALSSDVQVGKRVVLLYAGSWIAGGWRRE